jgi:peptide/nickel transport system ATP-binding protein
MIRTHLRSDSEPLLEVEDLHVMFSAGPTRVLAVNGVSFSILAGELLCLVGESGSGKSVTANAIMGLLPRASASVAAGRLAFAGRPLPLGSERKMRRMRGSAMGMIFQDPMSSLNPAHTVGMQIAEGIERHRSIGREAAWRRAGEMLDLVRIPDAGRRLSSYPHELSGGMRQRVMIAMALACEPQLLIADEPTTALDVTIQAQILALIDELRRELGIAVLLITHDLGVVADMADRVAVMYGGSIVETADVFRLFDRPAHPYTVGLMRAVPSIDGTRTGRLVEIPGSVPRLSKVISGCVFAPRCSFAAPGCSLGRVSLSPLGPTHSSACMRIGEIGDTLAAVAEISR